MFSAVIPLHFSFLSAQIFAVAVALSGNIKSNSPLKKKPYKSSKFGSPEKVRFNHYESSSAVKWVQT